MLPGQGDGQLAPQRSSRHSKTPRPDILQAQPSSRRSANAELKAQRSSRQTPKHSLQPQASSRRTPATEASAPRLSIVRPTSSASQKKRGRPAANDAQFDDDLDQPQAKRAKNDTSAKGLISKRNDSAPAVTKALSAKNSNQIIKPSSPAKKRKKRKSIGQNSKKSAKPRRVASAPSQEVESDGGHDPLEDDIQDQLRREHADLEAPAASAYTSRILQTIEPTQDTGFTPLKKRRKKHVSIGQQSIRKAKPKLIDVKEESVEDRNPAINDVPDVEEDINVELGDGEEGGDGRDEEDVLDMDGPRPSLGKGNKVHQPVVTKRRKRKSIGQQRRKRRAETDDAIIERRPQAGKKGRPLEASQQTVARGEIARRGPVANTELVQRDGSTATSKPRGRPPANTGRSKPPPSIPKPTAKHIPARKASSPKITRSANPGIPITVYRPPSSAASDEDLPESTRAPAARRKGFNAVDVLAQINLERLTKIADRLNAKPDATRIKRKALELYTNELESRLRHLSNALNSNLALETQVKQLGKEERRLKKEVREVEGERKEVKQRLEELESQKQRMELETVLRRIEKVARKGWELERGTGADDVESD